MVSAEAIAGKVYQVISQSGSCALMSEKRKAVNFGVVDGLSSEQSDWLILPVW